MMRHMMRLVMASQLSEIRRASALVDEFKARHGLADEDSDAIHIVLPRAFVARLKREPPEQNKRKAGEIHRELFPIARRPPGRDNNDKKKNERPSRPQGGPGQIKGEFARRPKDRQRANGGSEKS